VRLVQHLVAANEVTSYCGHIAFGFCLFNLAAVFSVGLEYSGLPVIDCARISVVSVFGGRVRHCISVRCGRTWALNWMVLFPSVSFPILTGPEVLTLFHAFGTWCWFTDSRFIVSFILIVAVLHVDNMVDHHT
jgi:hypothetical protein